MQQATPAVSTVQALVPTLAGGLILGQPSNNVTPTTAPQMSCDYLTLLSQMNNQFLQQQQMLLTQMQQQQQPLQPQPTTAATQPSPTTAVPETAATTQVQQEPASNYAAAASKPASSDSQYPPLKAGQTRGRPDTRKEAPPTPQQHSRSSSRSSWRQVPKRKPQGKRRFDNNLSFNKTDRPWVPGWRLQDYLTDLPGPPHPTREQLDQLQPEEFFQAGDIIYYKVAEDHIVVLQYGKHHAEQCLWDSNSLIHEYGLVTPVSDIRDATELPKISSDLPENWLKTAGLFFQPKSVLNFEHKGWASSCYCPPTTGDYVQSNVYTSYCFKQEYNEPKSHVIPFEPCEQFFLPNSSRVYIYSQKSKKAIVQTPSPFLLGWRWTPRPYVAANAQESGGALRQKLFYSVASPAAYREICSPYLLEPSQWDSTVHPLWQEPSRHDELYAWSKPLYGSETLGRVLFSQHPARGKELYIYSAMDRDFRVPVILNNSSPDTVERFLKIKLRPFYSKGYGKVICSICLFNISGDKFIPSLFTRTAFVDHFRREHHRNIFAIGLGFATQYHCRMLQAFALYNFSLAYLDETSRDDESRAPLSDDRMDDKFSITLREDLRSLLESNNQHELLSPAPGKELPFGWSEPAGEKPGERTESCSSAPGQASLDVSYSGSTGYVTLSSVSPDSINITRDQIYALTGMMETDSIPGQIHDDQDHRTSTADLESLLDDDE